MVEKNLEFFQGMMIFVDTVGIFASVMLANYWKRGKKQPRIFSLYVLFVVLTWVFIALTISDVLVITKVSAWYATLPIVRGLTFRLPLALVEIWMLLRVYGASKTG